MKSKKKETLASGGTSRGARPGRGGLGGVNELAPPNYSTPTTINTSTTAVVPGITRYYQVLPGISSHGWAIHSPILILIPKMVTSMSYDVYSLQHVVHTSTSVRRLFSAQYVRTLELCPVGKRVPVFIRYSTSTRGRVPVSPGTHHKHPGSAVTRVPGQHTELFTG